MARRVALIADGKTATLEIEPLEPKPIVRPSRDQVIRRFDLFGWSTVQHS